METERYFVVDLRRSFRGDPYVTVWRPEACGYAWPLSWGGRYTRGEIEARQSYFIDRKEGNAPWPDRFPVECSKVESISQPPPPGRIDNDAGPVVRNTRENRAKLRRWFRATPKDPHPCK